MKKILLTFFILNLLSTSVYAKVDKSSENYLKNKKHFSIINPCVEKIAEKTIRKSLKKETGGKYKVKFDGYTLSSMKQGIFKNLEITGQNLLIDDIKIPYLKIKSISDYNWIDYTQKPIVIKSDMNYVFEVHLTEDAINTALDKKEYQDKLNKVNSIAYPLFVVNNVDVKIQNNKARFSIYYNFPISPAKKDKVFHVTSGFRVENNKILASNIDVDKTYASLQKNKIANLINLLDPLSFTLSLIDEKKCNARIENVKIVDNIIQINGKIYVKGEGK